MTREGRSWPHYLLSGRVRTSTVALMVAFVLVSWVYDTYKPPPKPEAPASQVVPPGYVPDPDYTYVPRSQVRTPTTTTPTTSPTSPTETSEPTSPTETSEPTSPTETSEPTPTSTAGSTAPPTTAPSPSSPPTPR